MNKDVKQPVECMADVSAKSNFRKDACKVIDDEVKGIIKEIHNEGGIINGHLNQKIPVQLNGKGQVSGFGMLSNQIGMVADEFNISASTTDHARHDKMIVDNIFLEKVNVKDKGVFNFDFKAVEFNDNSALLGYYNDGTGHLYSVAKLVELTKDLVPFDAPIQAFDLSAEIWRGCSMFELAYHVKLVNDADLSYPIILDWNGGIADGRHRLIKALTLGHSTIKCVRMTYKPNFDKLAD